MVAETRHQSDIARKVMSGGTRAQIDRLSGGFSGDPAERRRLAIVSWAAMVGAMMIARSFDDEQLSEELLSETRIWIKDAVGQ